MSVKNFVQCGLVTPIAANTVELVLVAPTASYQYPPLDGGTLVIADSVARPTFYEIITYTHRIDNVLYGVVRAKEGTTARSWTGSVWVYQALTAQDYVDALALKANAANAALTGVPTAPTAAPGTNTNQIATMAALQAAIAALIESSPAALNTLNELAAALGDDPNFASTMTTALAGKEPSIAAGTASQMWLGNKTWATVLSQVHATLLTGLAAGSNSTILATDTLIAALAKIQNQLNNKAASTDGRLTDAREWTATEVSQAEAEAGTATTARKWTALRVWQACLASTLTGLNLTVGTAVAATDTVLVAIGKLQKQITDAATNLQANVRATVLTGYLVGTNVDVAATDTVLAAFGKVQAQINALDTAKLATGATAVAAGTLTGLTSTIAELNFLDGVTSNVQTQLGTKAPLASPAFTGVPTAPTPATATNSTQVATTAHVQANCALQLSLTGGTITGNLTVHTGFDGGYGSTNGGSAAWGANIWGMGPSYDGTGQADTYAITSSYGLSWLRGSHGSALAAVGEGLYVTQVGAIKGGIGSAGIWSVGNVTAYSDERLKDNIEVIEGALAKLTTLRGVTFSRNDMDGMRQAGVIAQEVQKVLPEAVVAESADPDAILSVAYGNLSALLIEAIKELGAKVETQAREIAELRAL